MTKFHGLQESLDGFEKILDDFASNSSQHDPNWRRNLVDLRRDLQSGLISIRAALQLHETAGGSSDASRALGAALSSIRSAIALHQAEWPVVAIDTEDAGYRVSVRRLRDATTDFRETARASVAALRQGD